MINPFIKKISKIFCILGLITLIYNSIQIIFFNKNTVINVITLLWILISILIMLYGIKKQTTFIKCYQIIGTYLLSGFAFLDNPQNITGVFFAIINYIIINEYKLFKNSTQKLFVFILYTIPIFISLFILKIPCENVFNVYYITIFFALFIKSYLNHKSTENDNVIQEGFQIMSKQQKINAELFNIAKEETEHKINKRANCG